MNFVVLDIETTGLYFELWDEPIEICAIKYCDDKEKAIFHEYMKPYKAVPLKVENITGITNKFLEDKKTKYQIMPKLRAFIGDDPVVAHNANFDVPFINFYFFIMNLPFVNQRICTMKTFKKNTGLKKGNLAYALDHFSIINNHAHSAIEDTKATSKLFILMKNIGFELVSTNMTEKESFMEIMLRIVKSNPFKKNREFLCMNKLSDKRINITLTVNEMENLFVKGKNTEEVYALCNNDYKQIVNTFYIWINNINVSHFYYLIENEKLCKITKKMIYFSKSFHELLDMHKKLMGKNINYDYYSVLYKITKHSDDMKYSEKDFDYYFSRGTKIEDIAKQIKRDKNFVCGYFVEWAVKNKNSKQDIIRLYLVGKNRLKYLLQNKTKTLSSKDIITLSLYKKNFFNL